MLTARRPTKHQTKGKCQLAWCERRLWIVCDDYCLLFVTCQKNIKPKRIRTNWRTRGKWRRRKKGYDVVILIFSKLSVVANICVLKCDSRKIIGWLIWRPNNIANNNTNIECDNQSTSEQSVEMGYSLFVIETRIRTNNTSFVNRFKMTHCWDGRNGNMRR